MSNRRTPQLLVIPNIVQERLASVRQCVHDALLSVGYTEKQIKNIFSDGSISAPPERVSERSISHSVAWCQRRAFEALALASDCELACHEHRWADAILAAHFMGYAQGALYVKEKDTSTKQEGSRKSAEKKMEPWTKILEAGDRIVASSKGKTRPTIDAIHQEVMAIPGMPQRKRSAFADRWKAHIVKKDSK